jgi:hypothetical protein
MVSKFYIVAYTDIAYHVVAWVNECIDMKLSINPPQMFGHISFPKGRW